MCDPPNHLRGPTTITPLGTRPDDLRSYTSSATYNLAEGGKTVPGSNTNGSCSFPSASAISFQPLRSTDSVFDGLCTCQGGGRFAKRARKMIDWTAWNLHARSFIDEYRFIHTEATLIHARITNGLPSNHYHACKSGQGVKNMFVQKLGSPTIPCRPRIAMCRLLVCDPYQNACIARQIPWWQPQGGTRTSTYNIPSTSPARPLFTCILLPRKRSIDLKFEGCEAGKSG